jgi:hypothetical protein
MSFLSAKTSTGILYSTIGYSLWFSCACLAWVLRTSSVEQVMEGIESPLMRELYSYSAQAMSKLKCTITFGAALQ